MKGRSHSAKGWSRASVLAWLFPLLTSCVVSPQPSPPLPELDGDGIDVFGLGTEDFQELLTFEAEPGTVKPAEGFVIVTNLDRDDAPSAVVVRDDGSFSVALPGFPGDTIRFQVKQGDARSEPIDLLVDPSALFSTVAEDAPECLVIDPARFVALDGSGDARSIVIDNQCETSATFAAPQLRRGQGPFTFTPTSSMQIAPGARTIITVRATGTASESEDVLFLELIEPEATRRAITLTVPDP